jgi:uncharacterized protein
MKKIAKCFSIIITITLMLLGILVYVLVYIPGKMTEKHTNEIVDLYFEDMNYDKEQFKSNWGSKLEEHAIIGDDKHKIPIYYYKPQNSYNNKTIVLVHWHESNHKAMYPIADFFLEQNYNVVLYDAPAHGANTAKKVSFGYYEKDDLRSVITFIVSKMSKDNIIGALGQSMGGTTIAYYSGTEHATKHLDFAIIDSAFTSMDAEIAWQIDKASPLLPTRLFIDLGNRLNRAIYNYSYEDVSAINSIKMNKIPTLILHSKADQKCPFIMGKALFEAIPHENKKLIIFENSLHLGAFWDENEKYKRSINEFQGRLRGQK